MTGLNSTPVPLGQPQELIVNTQELTVNTRELNHSYIVGGVPVVDTETVQLH